MTEYQIVTNLSCPKCLSIVDVYYPKEREDVFFLEGHIKSRYMQLNVETVYSKKGRSKDVAMPCNIDHPDMSPYETIRNYIIVTDVLY